MIARADDELVARIIAVAPEDRSVHGGQDVALKGAGARLLQRRVPGKVAQLGRPTDMGDLGRRLPQPQQPHQLRGVDQRADHAVERRRHRGAVPVRQPLRRRLPPDPPARKPELAHQGCKITRRLGLRLILPDPDVTDGRGHLRLAQIGRARQQDRIAIGGDDQALEEAEAESVIARQPELALGREQQQRIQPAPLDLGPGARQPTGELFFGEVQHETPLPRRPSRVPRPSLLLVQKSRAEYLCAP